MIERRPLPPRKVDTRARAVPLTLALSPSAALAASSDGET